MKSFYVVMQPNRIYKLLISPHAQAVTTWERGRQSDTNQEAAQTP